MRPVSGSEITGLMSRAVRFADASGPAGGSRFLPVCLAQ